LWVMLPKSPIRCESIQKRLSSTIRKETERSRQKARGSESVYVFCLLLFAFCLLLYAAP
jgi:hypothetical protein